MSYVNTQILRNGEPIKLRWGPWHIDMICEAAQIFEPDVSYAVLPPSDYVFDSDFAVCDPTDREEFFLYKGDIFKIWSSYD